jgi:hypothetical protein
VRQILLGCSVILCACGPGASSSLLDDRGNPAVLQARRTLPTPAALHHEVFARSCSPTQGVCHNGFEHPDLHTVGNLIQTISAPCNANRHHDPSTLFDGCEPEPDQLILDEIGFEASFVWFGGEDWNPIDHRLVRRFVLDAPSPASTSSAPARIVRRQQTIAVLEGAIDLVASSPLGVVVGVERIDSRLLDAIQDGDPNRDGIIGSRDPWRLIFPGKPERSYLVGRITGTVPGTRMPLANQALTAHEYVAIICWIEQLTGVGWPDPSAAIDYDRCRFAANVVDYTVAASAWNTKVPR